MTPLHAEIEAQVAHALLAGNGDAMRRVIADWRLACLELRAVAQSERLSEGEYADAITRIATILEDADAALEGGCPLKPDTVWCHQPIERYVLAPLHQHVRIDDEALLCVVTHYLDTPRLRTTHLDQLFFDALLFVEIDRVLPTLPDGTIQRTASRVHYPLITLWHQDAAFRLAPAMRRTVAVIKHAMLPALAGLAFVSGHVRLAVALLGAFAVQVLVNAAPLVFPGKRRRNSDAPARLVKLVEAYRMLEDERFERAPLRASLGALARMDVDVRQATRECLEQLAHVSSRSWREQALPATAHAAPNIGHAN